MMMLVRLTVVISICIVAVETSNIGAPAKPGCNNTCGSMTIPYPFGMNEGCYLNTNFSITCNTTHHNPPQAFLTNNNFMVTNISHNTASELRIMHRVIEHCNNLTNDTSDTLQIFDIAPPFTFSTSKNNFTFIGCNFVGLVGDDMYASGCLMVCNDNRTLQDGECNGNGCCQVNIPKGNTIEAIVTPYTNNNSSSSSSSCAYYFISEQDKFSFRKSYITEFLEKTFPAVLDWSISNTSNNYICGENATMKAFGSDGSQYQCQCKDGYEGNPYLNSTEGTCKDIDECKDETHNCEFQSYCENTLGNYTCNCPKNYDGDGRKGEKEGCKRKDNSLIRIIVGIGVGLVVIVIGSSWLFLGYKKWKFIQKKEKFFKKNGGLILEQHLSQWQSPVDSVKIFSQEELYKATNKFDDSTVVGTGGFGTVHKGVLDGGSVVAIKKSKLVDQSQINQFINEVIILSQINHRHVVRLLGCCLETKVPLLVYEFITNGTLFDHIHNNSLSWKLRLKIASEVAGVISYLHSSASTPIIHRDIKSTNILLDANFLAKVSDFGASKLVPTDRNQLSTLVQGTLGYLDPEYLLTSELTEKSDVYSFGILLLELITGKKPVRFNGPEEERNLAMYVLCAMKEGRLVEVVDKRMEIERNIDEIKKVAKLAKECLKVKGEERPSMKEVAMELERLRVTQVEHSWAQNNDNGEEIVNLLVGDSESSQNIVSESINTVDNSIKAQIITFLPDGR